MVNKRIQVSTDRLIDDMKNVVTDSEILMKEVGSELSDKAKQAKARLAVSLEAAKETYGDLQDRARLTVKAADEMVHEHPYTSMGVALAAGVVIGVLVARR